MLLSWDEPDDSEKKTWQKLFIKTPSRKSAAHSPRTAKSSELPSPKRTRFSIRATGRRIPRKARNWNISFGSKPRVPRPSVFSWLPNTSKRKPPNRPTLRFLPSDYMPTPEDLATLQYWQSRFKAQLQKPEPEAPIDPDTGRHKTYYRFDAFIRTCLLREMPWLMPISAEITYNPQKNLHISKKSSTFALDLELWLKRTK